eukprot:g53510.t1
MEPKAIQQKEKKGKPESKTSDKTGSNKNKTGSNKNKTNSKEAVEKVPVGCKVVLQGLKQEQFNGQDALVAGLDARAQRVVVVLPDLKAIKVRPENLRLAKPKRQPAQDAHAGPPSKKARTAHVTMDDLTENAAKLGEFTNAAEELLMGMQCLGDIFPQPQWSCSMEQHVAPPPRQQGVKPQVALPARPVHRVQCCECGAQPIVLSWRCEAADRHPQQHPLLKMQEPAAVSSGRAGEGVHLGVSCSSCGLGPIVGARFVCTVCRDLNLCGQCEQDGNHPASHHLCKLKTPVQQPATATRAFASARDGREAIRLPCGRGGPLLLPDSLNLAQSKRADPWHLQATEYDRDHALVLGCTDYVLPRDRPAAPRRPPPFAFHHRHSRLQQPLLSFPYYGEQYSQKTPAGDLPRHYSRACAECDYYRGHGHPHAAAY